MAPFYAADLIGRAQAVATAAIAIGRGYPVAAVKRGIRDNLPTASRSQVQSIYDDALTGHAGGNYLTNSSGTEYLADHNYRVDPGLPQDYQYTMYITWDLSSHGAPNTRLFVVNSDVPLTRDDLERAMQAEAEPLIYAHGAGYVPDGEYITSITMGTVVDAATRT